MAIFCVHVQNGVEGERYIMTELGQWLLGSQFFDAVEAFRNMREWAKEQRKEMEKQALQKESDHGAGDGSI